jgi:hypothetical protein
LQQKEYPIITIFVIKNSRRGVPVQHHIRRFEKACYSLFYKNMKNYISLLVTATAIGVHLLFQYSPSHAFNIISQTTCARKTTICYGKTRKARREQQVDRSRPKQFFDALDDANDKKKERKVNESADPDAATASADDRRRAATAEAAQERMDRRPDVSTMIVDEETGIEVVAQGKSVMDVVTRKAVQLSSLGPQYRLAQMFPGVPPEISDKYRVKEWRNVKVSELVEGLRQASMVALPDGTRDIPPHPSIANNAIDYVLANRHYLGPRMKRTLGRLTMRSASLGNIDETVVYQKLWKNFLTVENHISAPFRQIIMDAEGRVGPNFGNLDLKSYCTGQLYERVANYLVLKGMVAHWEKKVVDADYIEKTPMTKENYISVLARGDPKRLLPDPPILFSLRECTQVCAMAQKMTAEFVNTPELFDDFPPEVRFLEKALSIKGGTPMRQYMINQFCPAEGITPAALLEGLRRLMIQFENMQIDPYADITNIIERLANAMAVGTDDELDPYVIYLANKDRNGPGAFQTYTMNHEKLSLVRFLDSQYDRAGGVSISAPEMPAGFGNFFNFGGSPASSSASTTVKTTSAASTSEIDIYQVPKERAAGRPHNLNWLDAIKTSEEDKSNLKFGIVKPGKIIMEQ